MKDALIRPFLGAAIFFAALHGTLHAVDAMNLHATATTIIDRQTFERDLIDNITNLNPSVLERLQTEEDAWRGAAAAQQP